jgi:tetratricopeptide (TPR) repeat protein/RIO-like serine/threonine protein kinase
MTPERWRRIKSIATGALECPESERARFVETACAEDDALLREVRSLVRSAVKAADYLEAPAGLSAVALQPGARVGNWRILQRLGEGGMGTVYLAERVDAGFNQRAALKLVRGGFADSYLLHRFRGEQQILASLEHAHIARLIDGGTTDDRVPFVALEYVEGEPIDVYCQQHGLDLRQRLELFRHVCAAVHYAHQRLVVHRDIKPSNILVAADGTPKLLDFGIAKLIDPHAVRASAETQTLVRLGTPESASPEQLRGQPITVAVDVYALGVLLYRLLTGQSPYEGRTTNESDLVRAVCEEMPDPPGAVVRRRGRRGDGYRGAGGGSGDAGDAGRGVLDSIPADLDVIVMKALRKEPERRYGSAEQLADDVGRFLGGRPVRAAPDSMRYRAGKFLRRHVVAVVAAAIAALAVLGGAGVAVYQARVAAVQRARAEQGLAEVRRLANAFMFEFHDAVVDLPGALPARQLVVKRAAEQLDGLAREAVGDVMLQRELATANMRLGDILGGGGVSNLGDLKGAAARYASAHSTWEALAARPDAEAADFEGLAQVRVQLSRFGVLRGVLDEAENHAAAAVTLLERTASPGGAARRNHGLLATAFHQLGFVQARRGKSDDALRSLERAREHASSAVGPSTGDADDEARIARIQLDLGEQLIRARRAREAQDLLLDSRRRLDRLLAGDPRSKRYRLNLIQTLNTLGMAQRAAGNLSEAVVSYRDATTQAVAMADEEPEDQGVRFAALLSQYALGTSLLAAGSTASGVTHLRLAIADGERIVQAAPGHDAARHQVASARLELGEALLAASDTRRDGCREIGAGLTTWHELAERGRLPGESAPWRSKFAALLSRC